MPCYYPVGAPIARSDGMSMLETSPVVREAMAAGLPVVALESTVISHGLPFPENLAIAREMEAAIRGTGNYGSLISDKAANATGGKG